MPTPTAPYLQRINIMEANQVCTEQEIKYVRGVNK